MSKGYVEDLAKNVVWKLPTSCRKMLDFRLPGFGVLGRFWEVLGRNFTNMTEPGLMLKTFMVTRRGGPAPGRPVTWEGLYVERGC